MDKSIKAISEAYTKSQQTIDVCWTTNEGVEWLKKTLVIPENREEFRKILKEWYRASKPQTVRYLDGWRREGEDDVILYATVSTDSPNNAKLDRDIINFAETTLDSYP